MFPKITFAGVIFFASVFAANADEIRTNDTAAIPEKNAVAEKKNDVANARRFLFSAQPENFSAKNYEISVQKLLAAFEKDTGEKLAPAALKKVGIKLYTASGNGIATPKDLTRAVILEMEKRGFSRENILLVDISEKNLRDSGYLPRLRKNGENFEGCPVLALDSEKYYHPKWFYENPLPSKEIIAAPGEIGAAYDINDRLSFLPVPLLLGVDFWINLPMALDSPALGISAALGNATLWNISNQKRFLDNASNAQKAAIEIAAIPEFYEKFRLSILTFERYQYIGGPKFDANHCLTENKIWCSANPLILDYLAMQRMNNAREKREFPLIDPEPIMFIHGNTPPILLGSCIPSEITLVNVDNSTEKNDTADVTK